LSIKKLETGKYIDIMFLYARRMPLMQVIRKELSDNPLLFLLLVIPFVFLAKYTGWGDVWVFALSAVSVIPVAGLIGKSTESLAAYTGPKIGGLLNATLGNAAELIITLVAIRAGLLDLVKASITGSIIGNLLFVLGAAMLVGGVKNGVQKFDRRQAGNHAILLTLAVFALVIPSFFSQSIGNETSAKVEGLSLGVAIVMIVLYGFGLLYSFKFNNNPMTYEPEPVSKHTPDMSLRNSLILLVVATISIVFLSEFLVGAVEHVVENLHISEFFLGIILIPIVGNAAEHFVAVQVAYRNKLELGFEIAISSSLQIALFVAPLLVFVSLLLGHPLTLIFNTFELMALGAAVIIMVLVSSDGESNWLEGATLIAVYLILAMAFFLLP
jgi:Ca2+:H+ antiporter